MMRDDFAPFFRYVPFREIEAHQKLGWIALIPPDAAQRRHPPDRVRCVWLCNCRPVVPSREPAPRPLPRPTGLPHGKTHREQGGAPC